MNKIYKVMYSKVKQCAVVVSEIAKSHGHNEGRSAVRKHAALTAAVLIALGMFSFLGMPTAQADGDLQRNDFVAANDNYWYWDAKANNGNGEWKKEKYSNILADHRDSKDTSNYKGAGAKDPGAITAGIYAQAGEQTVTIGNRNAGASKGSVFIGEHSGYNKGNNNPSLGDTNNYVTSVGFESDATGWGSIAIGSNALAENSKKKTNAVEYEGNENTTNNKNDDIYGIKTKPKIEGASVALGYSAQAQDGNIAIGAYSGAKADSSSNTTYVSVGNSTIKRRITNVANGTADTDVATVGQMNAAIAQTGGSVKAGWGITKSNDNTISVKHNLSTGDSAYAAVAYADSEATGLILGGSIQDRNADEKYGATTETSVIVGARNALASNDNTVVIGGDNNIASRRGSTVVGGSSNTASGQGYSEAASVFGGSFNISNGLASVVLGGFGNVANNEYSTNSGGAKNVVFGLGSNNSGGLKNVVYASDNASSFGGVAAAVNGQYSTGVAGGSTGSNARLSFAAGFQSLVTDSGVRKTVITRDEYERKWSEQTREFGPVQAGFNPITNKYEQDDKISTALGYQATADEPGTIAFGHDAGDESGYTYEWETLTDEKGNPKQNEIDGTTNDYTKAPKSVKKKAPYTSAYYNRLVKAADGIEDHDAVVMEQLKNASGVGSKIKIYQTDENGNIKFDENNNPIEDTSDSDAVKTKRETAREASKDAWGQALGAGTFTTGTPDKATDASTSDQLITGKTLYDYDKPTASQNYVNVNNTTGQNLSALDAQVKANADALTKPNHNIKYYSVTAGPSLGYDQYTNENNDGAKGTASLAAGNVTHTDGAASTVVGSYSAVFGTGLQGAAALSYGTVNVNNNTDTTKEFSGVANSIVGQANVTTDSNAAIIYGAGNTVTDSYRDIDKDKAEAILNSTGNAEQLKNALQDAVPTSGAQVMVMGGGNSVDKAYMTQVTGVGNKVTGADSTYTEGTSTQYNFVDGFQNELTNGKHDYIIGSKNKVSGDSVDTNQSNIIFGDNHKLTNQQNNVIIGSSDTADDETTASNIVAIGHNAKVSAEGGVAIGSGSEASTAAGVTGYDPTTTDEKSTDTAAAWTSKKAAVSVGTADETRQITGVAAGKEETDAVNVAQLKKLNGMKANVNADNIGKNLNHKADGTAVTDEDKTANENDWGAAIGTGSIAADNGQLVTGKTVYAYNKPVAAEGKTLNYVSDTKTTGQNLGSLDAQVGTNTGDISNLKNLSNISSAGETVIKNLAKGSIGMEDGSHTTASHRDVNGVDTYKVDVTVDGQVTENNKGIVDGGTVYNAIQDVKTKTSADLANKANVDASNLSDENVKSWREKLGNGEVVSGNKGLVTGDTVFKAVDTKANRDGSNLTTDEADKFSEKIAVGKVEANDKRAVSGETVSKAISDLTGDMNTKLDGKANTSLDNITDTGKNVIRDLAKGSAKVIDGTNTTVTTVVGKGETPTTYAVNVEGKGTVTSGNTGLISGGTAYTELRPADGSYVKQNSTTAANLTVLDTGLKATSDLIHTNTSHDTIQIGENSTATKIDVSGKDANGKTTGRVITGVVSDANDPNSAANVGYVNGVTAANTQQIYRDMNNAYGRLNNNINKAAAGSNALAALHPLDYDPDDKADFAVGYGHYRNANAAAVGAFYHPNENTMVNVGVSLGNGDPGFNAGVSFKVGRGGAGREAMSKTEMAKVINSQSKEIDALKKDNADKDKRIDALEQKMAEILAKLDKNGK